MAQQTYKGFAQVTQAVPFCIGGEVGGVGEKMIDSEFERKGREMATTWDNLLETNDALMRRIAELERERDTMGAVLAAQSRNAVINGGTPTLTERAQTKRIAELERERDTAKTNALTCLRMMEQAQNECEALRGDKKTFPIATHNGLHIYSDADAVERKIISLEAELSAAIADARALATLLKEVDDANPTMAYSVKAYWVMKKYLQP